MIIHLLSLLIIRIGNITLTKIVEVVLLYRGQEALWRQLHAPRKKLLFVSTGLGVSFRVVKLL